MLQIILLQHLFNFIADENESTKCYVTVNSKMNFKSRIRIAVVN